MVLVIERVAFCGRILIRSGLWSTPNNAKVHYNYANLQTDVGNVSLAVKHYRAAIQSVHRRCKTLDKRIKIRRKTLTFGKIKKTLKTLLKCSSSVSVK